MATKIIRFSKSDESSLFDGADANTRATINIPASIAKFDATLVERIEQTYPDADVSAKDRVVGNYWATGFEDASDPNSIHNNYDVSAVAQQLAEELFDDGNAWMVEAE